MVLLFFLVSSFLVDFFLFVLSVFQPAKSTTSIASLSSFATMRAFGVCVTVLATLVATVSAAPPVDKRDIQSYRAVRLSVPFS